jgi:hypothetical protein
MIVTCVAAFSSLSLSFVLGLRKLGSSNKEKAMLILDRFYNFPSNLNFNFLTTIVNTRFKTYYGDEFVCA